MRIGSGDAVWLDVWRRCEPAVKCGPSPRRLLQAEIWRLPGQAFHQIPCSEAAIFPIKQFGISQSAKGGCCLAFLSQQEAVVVRSFDELWAGSSSTRPQFTQVVCQAELWAAWLCVKPNYGRPGCVKPNYGRPGCALT
jgi:hypothetical protein